MTCCLGHECHATGSATEARPLLATTEFDAVLVDLNLRDANGLMLATEIRGVAGPNLSSMLILMGGPEHRVVGQSFPFDGFLQEPIDSSSLERLLGAHAETACC